MYGNARFDEFECGLLCKMYKSPTITNNTANYKIKQGSDKIPSLA